MGVPFTGVHNVLQIGAVCAPRSLLHCVNPGLHEIRIEKSYAQCTILVHGDLSVKPRDSRSTLRQRSAPRRVQDRPRPVNHVLAPVISGQSHLYMGASSMGAPSCSRLLDLLHCSSSTECSTRHGSSGEVGHHVSGVGRLEFPVTYFSPCGQ